MAGVLDDQTLAALLAQHQSGLLGDQLLSPQRNPASPPQGIADALQNAVAGLRSHGSALGGKAAEYAAWLAARSGLLGTTAASVADPLAWGLTGLTLPIWASTEANGGERPFYRHDPATGQYIPADGHR